MVILLRRRPVACVATFWVISTPCVGAHSSQRSAVTCAVQFIGSIVACAWNGIS